MITHLLFDLDGTLVQMDERRVELGFMLRAIPRFAKVISPLKFRRAFWEAAHQMLVHDTGKTNFRFYVDTLARYSRAPRARIEQLAREAIEQDFAAQGRFFQAIPAAAQTLQLAAGLGYRLVIATNPVFPLAGVLARLRHSGLSRFNFDYITHAEVMHHCKPSTAFYRELLDNLALQGEQCLMVGNDPAKDLGAQNVGIKTFILRDQLIDNKATAKTLETAGADYLGSFGDLQQFITTRRES